MMRSLSIHIRRLLGPIVAAAVAILTVTTSVAAQPAIEQAQQWVELNRVRGVQGTWGTFSATGRNRYFDLTSGWQSVSCSKSGAWSVLAHLPPSSPVPPGYIGTARIRVLFFLDRPPGPRAPCQEWPPLPNYDAVVSIGADGRVTTTGLVYPGYGEHVPGGPFVGTRGPTGDFLGSIVMPEVDFSGSDFPAGYGPTRSTISLQSIFLTTSEQTQPPSQPGRPEVTVSGGNVTVSWAPPMTGRAPQSYLISILKNGVALAGSPFNVGLVNNVTGGPLPAGTYELSVAAVANGQVSLQSEHVSFTVGGVLPPAPPTLVVSVVGNTVTANWSPGSGGAPASYLVAVGTSPGGSEVLATNVGLATGGNGTLPSGTYFVRVTALNASGSASSNDRQINVPQ